MAETVAAFSAWAATAEGAAAIATTMNVALTVGVSAHGKPAQMKSHQPVAEQERSNESD